ncbi:uncharacterized protein PHALS_15215 [Plasmopara halstedii]|uniref:Uncharacterized protein n=1 Tax=Plasmopara halstedii TaxID=4781 RepID=A0A0P1B540_PLAHL|nr:uncharacterized protein PHALS_15215 [Plasmopara halstedii]CEG49449.1 hypothetical protein PHALS_15215 [Plasmopara halstedii]|eukprot:XP_024585818.1 hypothetical protein PHALS_15215 [Plasmopara halstedii]
MKAGISHEYTLLNLVAVASSYLSWAPKCASPSRATVNDVAESARLELAVCRSLYRYLHYFPLIFINGGTSYPIRSVC